MTTAFAVVIAALTTLAGCAPGRSSDLPTDELHLPGDLSTGFTTRYAGSNPYETAVAIAQVTFPASSHDTQPGAVILVRADKKDEAFAAVSLIHHPIDAPVLYVEEDRIPEETATAVRRFHLEGIDFDRKITALVVGSISDRVVEKVKNLGLSVRRIRAADNDIDKTAGLAAAVDDYRAALHADHPDVVVIGSLDSLEYALPALSFLAHAPAGLLYVYHDSIPRETAAALQRRFGPAYLYVMGHEGVVSQHVVESLSAFGHVQRISAPDPYSLSAYFAGYRDAGWNFGYWIGRTPRDFGWGIAEAGHNFTFVNPDAWREAVAGAILSHRGKHGPMLLVRQDEIPPGVAGYLDKTVRPHLTVSRDQLFNRGSIVGDRQQISVRLQGEIDGLLRPVARTAGKVVE